MDKQEKIKILVIGSGAREHCLVDKLAKSRLAGEIFSAPGNAGTSQMGKNVDIKADDLRGLLNFGLENKIGFTVVGPEVPLAAGIVDCFNQKGLKVFGPTQELAQLEGSKVFAKEIMREFKVPTANFEVFSCSKKAKEYLKKIKTPVVVKADGLAAGKGVVVCQSLKQAESAVVAMLEEKVFKEAGNRIIIEDCLQGQELSLLAFTDGETILPLAASRDYKRIFDRDRGPNTGGMGAYSPVAAFDSNFIQSVVETVFSPVIKGLAKKNKIYKGVLYAGLMIQDGKIYLLEFNVRFGDPETQAILPRLKTDFLNILLSIEEGRLNQIDLEWDSKSSVCLVLASKGYPGQYQKGKLISGLEQASSLKDVFLYHAGTRVEAGKVLTDGGRVLSLVGLGKDIDEARSKAYAAASKVSFQGAYYRRDIAAKN